MSAKEAYCPSCKRWVLAVSEEGRYAFSTHGPGRAGNFLCGNSRGRIHEKAEMRTPERVNFAERLSGDQGGE
jgi:hypothetical protein